MVYGCNDLQYNNDLFNSIINNLKKYKSLEPEKVIYNDPATIIFWNDGTKTVVKAHDDDRYDPLVGFLLCVMKRFYGNKSDYNDILRKAGCFEKRAEMKEHEVYVPSDVFEAFKNSVKNATEAIKSANQKILEQIKNKSTIEVMPIKEAVDKGYVPDVFVKPVNGDGIKAEIRPDKLTSEALKEQRTKLESEIDKLESHEERIAQVMANKKFTENARKVDEKLPGVEEAIREAAENSDGYKGGKGKPNYPKLEAFLKEHNLSYSAFDRLCGFQPGYTWNIQNHNTIRGIRKSHIDTILKATGKKYAELFCA